MIEAANVAIKVARSIVNPARARKITVAAVALRARTDARVGVCQPGAVLYILQNCSRMIIFGGGYPLVHQGKTIGGIGVSGSTVAEDMQCAEAAVEIYRAHASPRIPFTHESVNIN